MMALQELIELTDSLPEPLFGMKTGAIEPSIVGTYLHKESNVAVQLLNIPNGYTLPVNIRNELEVLVIYTGDLQVEMDGKKTLFSRGDVVTIPTGKGHICHAITDCQVVGISIPASAEYPDK